MTWGHHFVTMIDSHLTNINKHYQQEHKIFLKAGLKITMLNCVPIYVKIHRNGNKTINYITKYYDPKQKKEILTVKKIAFITGTKIYITTKAINSWYFRQLFEITKLHPRTLSTEHVIFRQNSITGHPETKIRLDKPIILDSRDNSITQNHTLKTRHFDKHLKKELITFIASFKHEFSVLAKLKTFNTYMEQPNNKMPYQHYKILPIKIKNKFYNVEAKNSYCAHNYIETTQGLLHRKWINLKLTSQDRLALASLTLFETAALYWTDANYFENKLITTAHNFANTNNLWKGLSYNTYNIAALERFHRHLGIVTYA